MKSIRKYVSIEVDINEALEEVSDADLREICAGRGIAVIDPDAKPKGRDADAPVTLSSWELEAAFDRLKYHDVYGALLALELALPREWRGLAAECERAFGAASRRAA